MSLSDALKAFGYWPNALSGSGKHDTGPITEGHSLYHAVGGELKHLLIGDPLRKTWAIIKRNSRLESVSWDEDGEPCGGEAAEELLRLCDQFRGMLEARIHRESECQPVIPTKTTSPSKKQWQGQAMLEVLDNPELSNNKIAERVGVSPSTLSRSKEFQTVAEQARSGSQSPPSGFITKNAQGETEVEAIDETPSVHTAIVRGEKIPGSKYFREFCSECESEMRVQQHEVGNFPVCEDCR